MIAVDGDAADAPVDEAHDPACLRTGPETPYCVVVSFARFDAWSRPGSNWLINSTVPMGPTRPGLLRSKRLTKGSDPVQIGVFVGGA